MSKVLVDRELLDRVRECLNYDPDTGVFTWIKIEAKNRRPLGSVAGSLDSYGHLSIKIDGRRYLAHRLAWLYMTGEWPEDMIDHRNRIKTDNRWENLRLCDNGQNKMNCGVQRNNKLGVRCVHQKPNGSFIVSIKANGKTHQKTLKTLDEAAHYANQLRQQLHGEFYSGQC